MRLYAMPSSGNSDKIRLLLGLLGRSVPVVDCEAGSDALAQAKAQGVLPFGKVPVLVLDDGHALAESNAILWYLGEDSAFVPDDLADRAQMLGWMFWEQYNHEPAIAVRQALIRYPQRAAQATPQRMADLLDRGHAALQTMQDALAGRDWLAGGRPSLAEPCLYPYTRRAGPLGGYDMDRFPAVNAWLRRVEALPGFAPAPDVE